MRSIKASVYTQHKIPAIGFFDKDGEEITSYDPEGYGFGLNVVEHTLKPDEELVGVYGVKDVQKWFTSLGFITVRKVMPGQEVSESRSSMRASTDMTGHQAKYIRDASGFTTPVTSSVAELPANIGQAATVDP